jgi:hypothetical protein
MADSADGDAIGKSPGRVTARLCVEGVLATRSGEGYLRICHALLQTRLSRRIVAV